MATFFQYEGSLYGRGLPPNSSASFEYVGEGDERFPSRNASRTRDYPTDCEGNWIATPRDRYGDNGGQFWDENFLVRWNGGQFGSVGVQAVHELPAGKTSLLARCAQEPEAAVSVTEPGMLLGLLLVGLLLFKSRKFGYRI